LTAGYTLRQWGEFEAVVVFTASDEALCELAVELVHAKKIRLSTPPTEKQRLARASFSARARSKEGRFKEMPNANRRSEADQLKI
jgi:hypothetical protein